MARTIFAQNPVRYIPALAEALKNIPEFEAPEWVMYVKTGVSKERPPMSEDFWFTRSASILRQLYIHGVVGVGKLRTRYGSRKDRGGRPDKFFKASGKIIRVILQQAEAAGLVEKVLRMQHGRRLTQQGRDFLDSIEVEQDEKIDSDAWIVRNVPVAQHPIDEMSEEDTETVDKDAEEENNSDDADSEEVKDEENKE